MLMPTDVKRSMEDAAHSNGVISADSASQPGGQPRMPTTCGSSSMVVALASLWFFMSFFFITFLVFLKAFLIAFSFIANFPSRLQPFPIGASGNDWLCAWTATEIK